MVRKGSYVKYIGDDPLMKDKMYVVQNRKGTMLSIYRPIIQDDGNIYTYLTAMKVADFEEVKHGRV